MFGGSEAKEAERKKYRERIKPAVREGIDRRAVKKYGNF